MGDVVVSAESVARRFGAKVALERVDLCLNKGSVYGLVGLNGAGKTTLIRLLLGLLNADSGSVRVLGKDPRAHEAALYRDMGVVLENDGFSGNLTFWQNMQFYAAARRVAAERLESYLQEFWGGVAWVRSREKVRVFSRGQRVQCALCRAFAGWPAVVVLDEPTVALDLEASERLARVVRASRDRGGCVLVSSHQFDAVEELCDRVGVLEGGAIRELHFGAGLRWYVRCSAQGDALLARHPHIRTTRSAEGWIVESGDSEEGVARLVREVVLGGGDVYEVRPAGRGIREMVRRCAAAPRSDSGEGMCGR